MSVRSFHLESWKLLAVLLETSKILEKGSLEVVIDPGLGSHFRLFLGEETSDGWRPVIDLSPLNEFDRQISFKMETVLLPCRPFGGDDFLTSFDLRDGYFRMPIHRSSRKYVKFLSCGTVYWFRVLCFELIHGPTGFPWILLRYLFGLSLRYSSSQVSGRLTDSFLLGGGNQTVRSDTPLDLSRSWFRDKRGEFKSGA